MKHTSRIPQGQSKRTLHWFWRFTRPDRGHFIAALSLAGLAIVVQDVIPPLIASQAFNRLQSIYQKGAMLNFWDLDHFVWWYIGFIIGGVVLWRLQVVFAWIFEVRANQRLMEHVFNHLQNQSSDFHANRFGGALVSNTNKFASGYEKFMDELNWSITTGLVALGASITALATVSWRYALVLLLFCVSYLYIMGRRTLRGMHLDRALAESESRRTAKLADTITNIATVRAFAGEAHERKLFHEQTEETKATYWRLLRFAGVNDAISHTGTASINIFAFVGGLVTITVFHAPLGALFLGVNYTMSLARRLWESNRVVRNINRALGDAAAMTETLDLPPSVMDIPNPEKAHIHRGSIDLHHVTFGYKEGSATSSLFDDFELHIKPGEKVGLVGHSGGGKTTITQLLLRFMDIESGEISIDGQNIAHIKQADLRRSIAYVPQESLLFHRTLLSNIAYGKPGASREEIEAVARMAHASDFIEKLPKGYETLVGERGIKLSGGQRQRIAIARAMLKDAPILVLDEATSALDSESGVLIQDALWKLMEGRTTIVIAHRLSTIQKMDRIVVLDDGKIVEQGSHRELLNHGGTYAKLWAHQSGGFIDE